MRIRAIVIRILQQFFRDKRTLALMLLAPLLILTMLWLVFNGKDYKPSIAAIDLPSSFIAKLNENDVKLKTLPYKDAMVELKEGKLDAVISHSNRELQIKLEGSDPTVNKETINKIQETMKELSPEKTQAKLSISYLYGSKDMSSFDNFGPVLLGFFAFFFVFLIAGVAFLRERTRGTLERLMASPLKRWEIVIGYVIGFGVFTTFQSAIIASYAIYVLDMLMNGSFIYVLIITLLLSLTALTLGTLLSSFANNELQMMQFIPLVVVPQIFFSGLFNLETISPWVRWIGPLTPLYYAADALRDVMIRGKGWSGIATDICMLIGFSLLFMLLNVVALKKHRRI
ncbi:ABC transporter permease [Fictibacillus gelatini]|uniref:ABC transporter permease n=1 Tax=Fictibacillus gelatini TaxID=225985 RepID=UPI0003FBF0B7|nr:ABC transporter permease [Fictibacillus gelatini]